MNRMDIQIMPLGKKDHEDARQLLRLDPEGGEDLLRALSEAPELVVMAIREGRLVAMAQVNEPVTVSN